MNQNVILAYGFALLLVYVLIRLLFTPLRYAIYIVYHAALGAAALFVINLVGNLVGMHLPINAASAISVGYLGIPGLVLLFVLQRMFA